MTSLYSPSDRGGHGKWPVGTKQVELRENERAFSPQGQSKLFVITRCPY